ncbi:MAG: GNAT family N-acetyltransferase [Anaerolineae bacterium]
MRAFSLVPAGRISPADRAHLINRAYADYYVPMHLTAEQMVVIDRCYDIDLEQSVVAMASRKVIGMALLARRGRTGWISGVGVAPEHRRKGVGRAMIGRLQENATAVGVDEISLEVIVQNTAARQLCAGLGFQETRELLVWRRPIESDALPIPAERLAPADPMSLLDICNQWRDRSAPWQRAPATLAHMAASGRLQGYRLDRGDGPVACCLVSGHGDTLSLMDVAIDPTTDIATPARVLLQALAHVHRGRAMAISNVPADDPLNRVLAALRFLVTVRQMEMKWRRTT